MLFLKINNSNTENLPIYGVKESSLIQYEKSLKDLKKGIESKEPNDLARLEEEDLIKINLDDAIMETEDEDDE